MENLIVFVVDALRFDAIDAVNAHGYLSESGLKESLRTPELNAIYNQSQVIPNLHAPATNTAPSVASILTGLYPREHGLYHHQTCIDDSVQTLPRLFSGTPYESVVFDNNATLEKKGIAGQFDRIEKGHVPKLINSIQRTNQSGTPVFAYFHTMDVHFPYTIPTFPHSESQIQAVLSEIHDLSEKLGDPRSFEPEDLIATARYDGVKWYSDNSSPVWEYLRRFRDKASNPGNSDIPPEVQAELYVLGVNLFDKYVMAPLKQFISTVTNEFETRLVLTADHGEVAVSRGNTDRPTFSKFGHGGKPRQDLIKVPGLFYNFDERLPESASRSVHSLVDIFPSLVGALPHIEADREVSGMNVFAPTNSSRAVFSEYTQSIITRDDRKIGSRRFPKPGLLKSQCLIHSNGDKFYLDGCALTRADFEASVETFIIKVALKLFCQWYDERSFDPEQIDSSFRTYKDRSTFILENADEDIPERRFFNWREDHFEQRDMYNDMSSTHEKRYLIPLRDRFPDYTTFFEELSNTSSYDSETADRLKGLGYLD